MASDEDRALRLAEQVTKQAADETWPFLNLNPKFPDSDETRSGFGIFASLTRIPDNISRLSHPIVIDLRGTQVEDISPLIRVNQLRYVRFSGIPACETDKDLDEISRISDDSERASRLKKWLEENFTPEPPEPIEGGPRFSVPDEPPITLVDAAMSESQDQDQKALLSDCRDKTEDLFIVADLASNTAPRLARATMRYREQINKAPTDIGVREIWSPANTLESILEVHENAVARGRPNEELPAEVAACLSDLLQTHRVWFLGHPGAREIEQRTARYTRGQNYRDMREASIAVVEAAVASDIVSERATNPAIENAKTSGGNTPAAIAALSELEEWSWNFVATIVRRLWAISKDPPGGFVVHTISATYLAKFVIANEPSLQMFAYNFMPQGPLWWDALMASIRRFEITAAGEES